MEREGRNYMVKAVLRSFKTMVMSTLYRCIRLKNADSIVNTN